MDEVEVQSVPTSNATLGQIRQTKKQGLISAYEAFLRKEPMSLDNLLKVVTKFAYTKVLHLEHDFREFGSYETADDWAQEVAVKVWQALTEDKFVGTPEEFYSWVHKIAFNRAQDAFKELEEEQKHKMPLFVDVHKGTDADEEVFEEDNPEIYSSPFAETWVGNGVDANGRVKYKQIRRSSGTLNIPESVKGKDYLICIMILDGLKQAEIAEKMGMTHKAVRDRLYRLRLRLKEERERATK